MDDRESVSVVVPLVEHGLADLSEDLPSRLEIALARAPHTVVVDMSTLTHLSSTAVAGLLWVKRHCAARNVTVVLRNPSRSCTATLERTGLLAGLSLEREEPMRPDGR